MTGTEQEPPIYLAAIHRRRHTDTPDPGCPHCVADGEWSRIIDQPPDHTHPAGGPGALHAREQAMVTAADRAWLTRRAWWFILAALLTAALTAVMALAGEPAATALMGIGCLACTVAAWHLRTQAADITDGTHT